MTNTFWSHLIQFRQLHWVALLFVLLYAWWTLRILSRHPKKLVYPALLVFLASTVLYWFAYDATGVSSFFASLSMAVFSALDLFVFRMNTTVAIASNFFYSSPDPAATNRLVILVALFLCAGWTTSILVVNQLASKFFSRIRVRFLSSRGENTHLFLGVNQEALALMEDLGRDPQNTIIAVLFPSEEQPTGTVSFLQILRGVNTGQSRQIRDAAPKAVVLFAGRPFREYGGNNIFEDLGFQRLALLSDHPDNAIYCFLDKDDDNMSLAERIPLTRADIYCFAHSEGLNEKLKFLPGNPIHLTNTSGLAVMDLLRTDTIQPIRYADIAMDKDGHALGWVKSPFRSLILGFGQAGRAALSFLYEYGSFVGKDRKPVPFHCQVIDRNAHQMRGEFQLSHPAIPAGQIEFSSLEIGSDAFWDYVMDQMDTLNYIFIALGNDRQSVQLALNLLEKACSRRTVPMDRFCIALKLDDTEKYRPLVDFYQESYGVSCIHLTGNRKTVWSVDNISWKRYQAYARRFYDAYQAACGEQESWDERHRRVLGNPGHSALWNKLEIDRKESQAFSNYFHRVVKDRLCPPRLKEDGGFARDIPAQYQGAHYLGKDEEAAKVLEYLAIGEHIRWQASHAVQGYADGEEKREDRKIHPDMKEYSRLDGITRHYDWIVIKTTLNLLREEKSGTPEGHI